MKTKFFLDMDSTMTESISAFCQVYNLTHKYIEDFVPADHTKVNQYDFKDQCPLLQHVQPIFESKQFFNLLTFFPDAKEVIYELNKKYQVIICSIGTHVNISRKAMWLYYHLGFVKDLILISNGNCHMDKSLVNMEGAIFLDDVASNLFSSNADFKYCYGKNYPWNELWEGDRLLNWKEVGDIFL